MAQTATEASQQPAEAAQVTPEETAQQPTESAQQPVEAAQQPAQQQTETVIQPSETNQQPTVTARQSEPQTVSDVTDSWDDIFNDEDTVPVSKAPDENERHNSVVEAYSNIVNTIDGEVDTALASERTDETITDITGRANASIDTIRNDVTLSKDEKESVHRQNQQQTR